MGSALRVAAYAARTKARAPVATLCASVFAGKISGAAAVQALMSREVGEE